MAAPSPSSLPPLRHPCEGRDPEGPQPKHSAPCVSDWKHKLLALDARLRGHDGEMALFVCFVFRVLGGLCLSCRLCAFAGMTGEMALIALLPPIQKPICTGTCWVMCR
jgi:hypothetical protein